MEFVQFHPTALYLKNAPRFLLSEALRGEGAYLRNIELKRFMPKYHEAAELAPRDVVARAIAHELETGEASRCRGVSRPHPLECRARAQAFSHHLLHLHAVQHRHRQRAGSDSPGGALCHGRRAHRSSMDRLPCPDSMRPARWRAPACTARIGWPAIPCWKVWCTERVLPRPCASISGRAVSTQRLQRPAEYGCGQQRATGTDRGVHQESAVADVAVRRCGARRKRPAAGGFGVERSCRSSAPASGDRRRTRRRTSCKAGLLIARSALAREESRGAHYRLDFPLKNDAKFHKHSVVSGDKIRFQ